MDETPEARKKRLSREATRRYMDKVRADPERNEARLAKQRAWHKRNNAADPVDQRHRNIRNSYGVGPEVVHRLWQEQDKSCPGCGVALPDPAGVVGHSCHIDHCHKTGELRGILCRNCNLALGHAKDNAAVLRSLAAYLEK